MCRSATLAVVLLVGVASLVGCTTTLIPPADVGEPTTIYLLDHGRTSSLVLPDGCGGMIRYAYGDWQYYALRRTGTLHAARAILWPTQGALGRRQIPVPPTEQSVQSEIRVPSDHVYPIQVERQAVDRLRNDLERRFRDHEDTLVVTEGVDFAFVHDPEPYWLFHDSNEVVAQWLRRLGVPTRGCPVYSSWRIRSPD